MTRRYSPLAPLDALYIAARAYPGGVEALAQRLGMSPHVLYKKLQPPVDTHHVNFEEASAILDILENAGRAAQADMVIQAFNWRHQRVAVRLPDVAHQPSAQLLESAVSVMRQDGQLAGALQDALADDGRINSRELQIIEQHAQACITALLELLQRARDKFQEEENEC
jgi:hypothetical protein